MTKVRKIWHFRREKNNSQIALIRMVKNTLILYTLGYETQVNAYFSLTRSVKSLKEIKMKLSLDEALSYYYL